MKEKIEERMPPVHPGEILLEEFMNPLQLSQNRLANATGMPQSRIQGIVNGTRGITSDTAMRLAAYFGTSPEFWLYAQAGYELEAAEYSGKRQRIEQQIHPAQPAEQPIIRMPFSILSACGKAIQPAIFFTATLPLKKLLVVI